MSFERLSEPGQRAKYLKIINCWPKSPTPSKRLRDGSILASTEGSLSRSIYALAFRVSSQRSKVHRNSESLGNKHARDEQNGKFAAFEKQYIGQLAGSQDKKLKILAELNSQLDANAQTPHRGEPDQSYTPPCLAQQLPRNAPLQTSTRPQAVQQQSVILQSQLSFHQPLDTNHCPDGVKTKNEIAAAHRQLMEAKAAAGPGAWTPARGLYKPSSRRHNCCRSKFTSPGKRTEGEVLGTLGLAMLVSLPWIAARGAISASMQN
jgi:hypothetical protein